MSDAADADLIRRFVAGDGRAFDDLLGRYEHKVYAIAFRMTGHAEDARDVTQEVFLSAYSALRRFRHDAQIGTWFHRVAVNASLDRLRKRKRRAETSLELVVERPARGDAPDEHAEAAVRAREVQRALDRLSADHRAVIVLHDLQDLDYAAVGEALNIPVGTVKSRIHRARAELAVLLGHLRDTEPHEGPEALTER